MLRKFTSLLVLSVVLIFSSCVAQKDYDELLLKKSSLEGDNLKLEEELEIAKEKINRLEVQVAKLKEDNAVLQSDFNTVDTELKEVKSQYTRIKQLYDNLLTNSGQLNQDLAQQQQRLLAIEDDLNIEKKKNEELAKDLAIREQRVNELEQLIADKDKAVQELKKKVTDALLNFEKSDLSVEVKNGKVYVSLAEQLLFGSGSTTVDAKGVGALKQLAGVLSGNPDINIMVEGHTDNVQFSKKQQYMSDNWDLSVLRATSIVKILVQSGVDSQAIMASGKGEHSPVALNDTAENKAKNRRTEIILTPKLDELFQLLESY